jgi:hypothetical protein
MATKADRDEDEKDTDKDEADEDESSTEKADAKPATSDAKAKKASAKDEADDEDEEEEEAPAPKRAKGPGARGPGARSRGPGAARKVAPAESGGSLGKSVLLFFVIVVGLGGLFYALGRETPNEPAKPKWKVGDVADVEITLVKSDRTDLACAATDEVAGKHCAFEDKNKPWSKGPSVDDKVTLRPYTTVDHLQFTAAGLWSDPAMAADKLPSTRFSVKCKLKVEGQTKTVFARWEQIGQWYENHDWFAGTLSDCKLGQ